MLTLASLLTALGIADLGRHSDAPARRGTLVRALILGLVATVSLTLGNGLPWWTVPAGVAIIAAWLTLTPMRRPGAWALAGLAAVMALLILEGRSTNKGTLETWFTTTSLAHLGYDRVALGVGCLLFLMNSMNVVVRTVLMNTDENPVPETLKGGRILGPLERLVIFAMAVTGQLVVVGALIAAKSIIRFPEITADKKTMTKTAEYFLIGSFVSWIAALGAALLIGVL